MKFKFQNNPEEFQMEYRKLGKTGLEISEIIFGGGAV